MKQAITAIKHHVIEKLKGHLKNSTGSAQSISTPDVNFGSSEMKKEMIITIQVGFLRYSLKISDQFLTDLAKMNC